MGGTFMSMPEDYRSAFIAQLHNALSGFTGQDVDEAVRYGVSRPLGPLLNSVPQIFGAEQIKGNWNHYRNTA